MILLRSRVRGMRFHEQNLHTTHIPGRTQCNRWHHMATDINKTSLLPSVRVVSSLHKFLASHSDPSFRRHYICSITQSVVTHTLDRKCSVHRGCGVYFFLSSLCSAILRDFARRQTSVMRNAPLHLQWFFVKQSIRIMIDVPYDTILQINSDLAVTVENAPTELDLITTFYSTSTKILTIGE